jgi:hypothetical protein
MICSGNQCIAPTCSVGQHQCLPGNILQICDAAQTGWTTQTTCASPNTCLPGKYGHLRLFHLQRTARERHPSAKTAANTCVGCLSATDCTSTAGEPLCNTVNDTCVACLGDSDCAATPTTPVCNTTTGHVWPLTSCEQQLDQPPVGGSEACVAFSASSPSLPRDLPARRFLACIYPPMSHDAASASS